MAQIELILLVRKDWESTTEGIQITRLLGDYAIVRLEEEQVTEVLKDPGILYAELPNSVFLSAEQGKAASCINNRPATPYEPGSLSGKGVLVGIIDSGERVIIMSS